MKVKRVAKPREVKPREANAKPPCQAQTRPQAYIVYAPLVKFPQAQLVLTKLSFKGLIDLYMVRRTGVRKVGDRSGKQAWPLTSSNR